MDIAKQFREWLEEISRWGRVDWFVRWYEGQNKPYSEKVLIYTKTNEYAIVAKEHEDGHTYLGCVVSKRKPRAGESWTRGNDLPDGDFSRGTWKRIKDAIIAYELVKIAKPVRQEGVPETGPSKE